MAHVCASRARGRFRNGRADRGRNWRVTFLTVGLDETGYTLTYRLRNGPRQIREMNMIETLNRDAAVEVSETELDFVTGGLILETSCAATSLYAGIHFGTFAMSICADAHGFVVAAAN